MSEIYFLRSKTTNIFAFSKPIYVQYSDNERIPD